MARRDDPSPPNYYARLGVRPSASDEVIQAAYREKARETHPDHNPGDPEAAERFRKVQEAYRVLRDPGRRAQYDAARSRQSPEVVQMAQQAPAGCGGYLWRVFAGGAAVAVFFVLEAMGVWAAGPWTILLAIGGAALVAGLVTAAVADYFPEEATDVSLRLDGRECTMWADGRTVLHVSWDRVSAVRFDPEKDRMVMRVDRAVAQGLCPVPPVLTRVDQRRDEAILQFDLSDIDVPQRVLVPFLRVTKSIPFPAVEA